MREVYPGVYTRAIYPGVYTHHVHPGTYREEHYAPHGPSLIQERALCASWPLSLRYPGGILGYMSLSLSGTREAYWAMYTLLTVPRRHTGLCTPCYIHQGGILGYVHPIIHRGGILGYVHPVIHPVVYPGGIPCYTPCGIPGW